MIVTGREVAVAGNRRAMRPIIVMIVARRILSSHVEMIVAAARSVLIVRPVQADADRSGHEYRRGDKREHAF